MTRKKDGLVLGASFRHDKDRLASIYEMCRKDVLPRLHRKLLRGLDSLDVLIDTALVVFHREGSLQDAAKLSAYARKVAASLVAQEVRKARRGEKARRGDESYEDVALKNPESSELLHLCRAALNQSDSELFEKIYAEDWTDAQLSASLGIAPATLRKRKERLRRRLREVVARHLGET